MFRLFDAYSVYANLHEAATSRINNTPKLISFLVIIFGSGGRNNQKRQRKRAKLLGKNLSS